MKAYVARDRSGAVTSGWLLRKGTQVHSTMCRLRRTQPEEVATEEASIETMLQNAAHRDAQPAK